MAIMSTQVRVDDVMITGNMAASTLVEAVYPEILARKQ